jgi:hypothetical protein
MVAILLALVILPALLAGCDGADTSQADGPDVEATAARATLVTAATAGLVPEGLVVSTATPDLSEALPPDGAVAILSLEPTLDTIISAVAARDAGALLATFDWQPRVCSGVRGSAICDDYDGARVDTIAVGPTTEFASGSVVRRYVDQLLAEPPPSLQLVVQSRNEPWRYVLGFEGAAKFTGFAPLASADSRIAGMRLVVDLSQAHPIVHFDLLAAGGATAAGRELIDGAPDDYRLLLFSE